MSQALAHSPEQGPGPFQAEQTQSIGKYVPPPSGLKPAALWGTEERLRDLFGDGIASLRTTKRDFIFRYRSASHWLDHFGTSYGPMVTTLKALDATTQEQFSREVISPCHVSLQICYHQEQKFSIDQKKGKIKWISLSY